MRKTKGKIKVVLEKRIRGLGVVGEAVSVKKGYFRNYLQPNKFAVIFSQEILDQLQHKKENYTNSEEKKREFEILNKQSIIFVRQASTMQVLYGSVSLRDIQRGIQEKYEILVPQQSIILDTHVKKTGLYEILVDLGEDLTARMSLAVAGSELDAAIILKGDKNG